MMAYASCVDINRSEFRNFTTFWNGIEFPPDSIFSGGGGLSHIYIYVGFKQIETVPRKNTGILCP